ncbi:hypothetical protein Q4601_17015 [Shewanella sp. 1_MG-2023]|uniref:Uncharacterized protein n=1 Tax=Shewanella electrodiphila TaxID=934143 RepID=A0ABT0KR03_9GAMM|nr:MULTISPECIES: hypothetical protein [Shewanella]MCC4833080.1 hypothetical protein [Shewanella sp. 10N.7]MCL1046219.1 hypothetical protein [Shewanella electrodiphila]MDO6613527.1 hypothetical protein [Shewanella sp. 7_MG-2023]MDO6773357.1 hypothetical protein [Shewanella sp. 2_MG-2023]MDO6796008.1 hypothetical protein [Shewanella sp. 1_MG-2023]
MRNLKLSLLLLSAMVSSNGIAAVTETEFVAGVTQANEQGVSLAEYALAQFNATPEDAGEILALAIQATDGNEEMIIQVLASAAASGMDPDEILAIALANGVDPSIVAKAVEETLTAGGGSFGSAPAPGAIGSGGGSGGGAETVSTN